MIPRLILNALRYLGRRPMRTVLILQGVIWGTALGVFPAAIIRGSVGKLEKEAAALGGDRIFLSFDRLGDSKALGWEEIASLRQEYGPDLRSVSGLSVLPKGSVLRFGVPLSLATPVVVTDEQGLSARGMKIAVGRSFTGAEVAAGAEVCVLESDAAEALYPNELAVGRVLNLGEGLQLEIIGVTAARIPGDKVLDEFGYESDHAMSSVVREMKRDLGVREDERISSLRIDQHVMVPHTLFPELEPEFVEMRAEPDRILDLRDRLRTDMIQRGLQPILYVNAMIPFLYGETLDRMLEMNRVVFVCCVLVGTCIVCVLMILSIVERRGEIAIRRVEGARRWHVALQLVVETGTVCAVGGVIGVPLGLGLAAIRCALEPLAAASWAFPPVEASIIVMVVTLIGLVGGLLPAWRAVRVDPIEILRYE